MTTNLSNKAMLVDLTIHQYDASKKDKTVTREVLAKHNASSNAGSFNKRLLDEAATKGVSAAAAALRTFHYSRTLPWLNDGPRILSSELFEESALGVRRLKSDFERLADQFALDFPQHIEQARLTRNGLFNLADYPRPDKIRAKFGIEVNWFPLPDSGDFRINLGQDVLEHMQRSLEETKEEALKTARNDVYKRLAERLTQVSEQFGDPDRRIFDSTITGLRELCRLIPGLNVTGDSELESLRVLCLQRIAQHEPDQIRNNDTLRADTAKAADDILRSMGLM